MKKRKQKKPRSAVVLGMLLSCKGGPMHDRREPRGGAHNEQSELLEDAQEEQGHEGSNEEQETAER